MSQSPLDVSATYNNSNTLLEKQVSLELAQQISHVGSWDWNIETGDLAWSDEIYRIFGLTPQEFGASYEAFLEFVHPEDRQLVQDAVVDAVAGKKTYDCKHRVLRRNGSIRFVHEKGEVFRDDDGQPLHMLGAVHDITDIKLALDEIKAFNQDLEQRVEQRTTDLTQSNSKLYAEIQERKKAQDGLLEANQAIQSTLDQLKETQAQLIQSEKVGALGQLVAGIAHEINTPAGAIQSAIQELGTDYFSMMEGLLEMFQEMDTNTLFMFMQACQVVAESTERRSTSQRRRTARALEAILEDGGVSDADDLAQDLALIGFTEEYLEPYLPMFQSASRSLIHNALRQLGLSQIRVSDIKLSIGRITHLVRALKNHSHMDQGEISEVSIPDALDDTLTILRGQFGKTIVVERHYEDIPKVRCYEDQLNQVWLNIIQNATQAMRGGGTLTIRVLLTDQEKIAVEVEDSGVGIAPDIMPRIFEPYFSTKPKGEGMGLGLSICKQVVDAHHGVIIVDSEPGKTVFRVEFPIDDVAS